MAQLSATPMTQKLRWRCRRGMKELDILFERFLVHTFADLSANDYQILEHLLEQPDQDIYDWVAQRTLPPSRFKPLIARLRETSDRLP